jgi:hypothetical protein
MTRAGASNRNPMMIGLLFIENQSTVNLFVDWPSAWKSKILDAMKVKSKSKLLITGESQANLSLIKKATHAETSGRLSKISASKKGEDEKSVAVKVFLLDH